MMRTTEDTKIIEILKNATTNNWSLNSSFKTFAISKVAHLALVKDVPSSTIAQLKKTEILNWNILLEKGGLNNVDIFSKVISLHCSWVKRLYDNRFHAWKIIPLFFIKN